MGIPENAIIYEPIFLPSGKRTSYIPDFALIDLETKEPLAIFEVKSNNKAGTLSSAGQQLITYLRALRDKTVRGYVATPNDSSSGFDFYTFEDDGQPNKVPPNIINLNTFRLSRITEKKEILAIKKEETTDNFYKVCFCSSFFSVLVVIADIVTSKYFCITLLTTKRMVLISAAIALLIIPYVQKFKGLGIEIERGNKHDTSE